MVGEVSKSRDKGALSGKQLPMREKVTSEGEFKCTRFDSWKAMRRKLVRREGM